jgi:hypothetical protein
MALWFAASLKLPGAGKCFPLIITAKSAHFRLMNAAAADRPFLDISIYSRAKGSARRPSAIWCSTC